MRLAGLIGAGLLLAAIDAHADAAKGPRVPPGQWAVDYAKEVCILSRDGIAGEPGIAIRTAPFADQQDLLIYLPRTGEKARSIRGRLGIDARPLGPERWISIAEPGRTRKLIDTRIWSDELAALTAGARSIRLSSDAGLDVIVTLPKIVQAMTALRACEIDLAGRWGVDPTDMARWARTAVAETDLRSLFWNKDYRKSVVLRKAVRAVLEIDEQGAVTGCRITQSSRVSWVDIRFCETLRTEAKFRPAVDASGRAVPGKFVTPAITSALIRR